jgi:hypothetical protein
MSNYSKSGDFTQKDIDHDLIEGADFDTEFDAIEAANSSKADKAVPAAADTVAGLDVNGNLYDTGILVSALQALVDA